MTTRSATAPDGTTVTVNRTKAPTHMFLVHRNGKWVVVTAGNLKTCTAQVRAFEKANERHPDKPFTFALVEAN